MEAIYKKILPVRENDEIKLYLYRLDELGYADGYADYASDADNIAKHILKWGYSLEEAFDFIMSYMEGYNVGTFMSENALEIYDEDGNFKEEEYDIGSNVSDWEVNEVLEKYYYFGDLLPINSIERIKKIGFFDGYRNHESNALKLAQLLFILNYSYENAFKIILSYLKYYDYGVYLKKIFANDKKVTSLRQADKEKDKEEIKEYFNMLSPTQFYGETEYILSKAL